ncbi:MAG: threo-3-hydroxy-L-aspartate ammonia-lyase [Roseiflexaceae bacterium]
MATSFAIGADDVYAATERLAGLAHRTPIFSSQTVNRLSGYEVFFKAENLQRSGSFKFRGAYNRLSHLTPEQRRGGVVAFSSGNHAQGVAIAAQLLGIPALIVMPDDAPAIKVAATRGYGADVHFYNRKTEDREAIANAIAQEHGAVLVPPFNDPLVMAGQGTLALELLEQVPDLDTLVIPVGGGGLIAGCAVAARSQNPNIRIIGVEADDADDTYRSLAAGQIVRIPPPQTIADGIRLQAPGTLTFPIVQQLVESIALVSDAEIIAAVRLVFSRLKLVIEPTAGVGVAAVLQQRLPSTARRVGVVLCGGNIEPAVLAQIMQSANGADER